MFLSEGAPTQYSSLFTKAVPGTATPRLSAADNGRSGGQSHLPAVNHTLASFSSGGQSRPFPAVNHTSFRRSITRACEGLPVKVFLWLGGPVNTLAHPQSFFVFILKGLPRNLNAGTRQDRKQRPETPRGSTELTRGQN